MTKRDALNNFYVYCHKRAGNGEPFYYGKGRGNRANVVRLRGEWHSRIVAKHGIIVEILKDGLTEREAFDLEIDMIAKAKENGERIINQTSGGEGAAGCEATKQAAKKVGQQNRLMKRGIFSLSHQERLLISSQAGKKGGAKCRDEKIGAIGLSFSEKSAIGKRGGATTREKKVGFCKLTSEEKSAAGKLGAARCKDLGLGIFSDGVRSKAGKASCSQQWRCVVCGHITQGPGPMGHHRRLTGHEGKERV